MNFGACFSCVCIYRYCHSKLHIDRRVSGTSYLLFVDLIRQGASLITTKFDVRVYPLAHSRVVLPLGSVVCVRPGSPANVYNRRRGDARPALERHHGDKRSITRPFHCYCLLEEMTHGDVRTSSFV